MKRAICTISTESHLFKSKATLKSVKAFFDVDLFCLLTDTNNQEEKKEVAFTTLFDLTTEAAKSIIKKYNGDKLRWALKPIYTLFLLEKGYDAVIYVDNDIYFHSSPDFLFEKLKTSSFLLTPHFYKSNPKKDQNWLEANYRVGLYNAGFFGVNKNAIPILDWWAGCCLYGVKKAYWRGLYDDQKYLDLVPVIFDKVEIVKHRGCNFAGWNCNEVLLEERNNQLYINGDQLVFIHYAQLSMEMFSDAQSPVYNYYIDYLETLKKYNPNFEFQGKKRNLLAISTYFYYLRWKLNRLFEK